MDDFTFFNLIFDTDIRVRDRKATKYKPADRSEETVAEEFFDFFYRNNLTPLFTNEHRTTSINVGLIDAQSVLKTDGKGGKARRILLEFAKWLNMGMDNQMYESEVFKLIFASKDWNTFLSNLEAASQYMQTILPNYLHNIWNIAWYDKDKSGTRASGVF